MAHADIRELARAKRGMLGMAQRIVDEFPVLERIIGEMPRLADGKSAEDALYKIRLYVLERQPIVFDTEACFGKFLSDERPFCWLMERNDNWSRSRFQHALISALMARVPADDAIDKLVARAMTELRAIRKDFRIARHLRGCACCRRTKQKCAYVEQVEAEVPGENGDDNDDDDEEDDNEDCMPHVLPPPPGRYCHDYAKYAHTIACCDAIGELVAAHIDKWVRAREQTQDI